MKNKLVLLIFYFSYIYFAYAQENNSNVTQVRQYLMYQVSALEAAMRKKVLEEQEAYESHNEEIKEYTKKYFDNKAAAARLFGTLNTEARELIDNIMVHCMQPHSNLLCLQKVMRALEQLG